MSVDQALGLLAFNFILYGIAWVISSSKLTYPLRRALADIGTAGWLLVSLLQCPICLAGELALAAGLLGVVSFPAYRYCPSWFGLTAFVITSALLIANFTGLSESVSAYATKGTKE